MLFKETIGGSLSGSIGNIVASHNQGGAYFRSRAVPTNPNTPEQQFIRGQVSLLTSMWGTVLSQAQRDGWELYAANVPLINRIGDPHNVSGAAMFLRSNVGRSFTGVAVTLVAPTLFNLGARSPQPMGNATEAGQTVDFAFLIGVSDPWASETGSFTLFFVSRPQNPSINFFRGPYRFAGFVQGDPAPPASPQTVAAPFAFVAGQKIFGRAVVTYLDGRYTADSFHETIAIA